MINLLILAIILLLMVTFWLLVIVIVVVQNNRKLRNETKWMLAYIKGVGVMEGNIYE